MNHLKRYAKQVASLSFIAIFLPGILALFGYIALREILGLDLIWSVITTAVVFMILVFVSYMSLTSVIFTPIDKLWQAIWHISPGKNGVAAPVIDNLKIGRELVSSMVMEIYNLASHGQAVAAETGAESKAPAAQPVDTGSLIESLPVSLFVLDKDRVIRVTNAAACSYVGLPREKVIGRSVYDVLHLSFQSDDTLDNWLKEASEKRATDTQSWDHIRMNAEGGVRQFDMAATYSKDDSTGHEVVIALFDRTAHYAKQDQSASYVAIAVHELRTPLTLLRGYIEVFEDELGEQLSPEHKEFMRKMSVASQTLTAFVSNILNVARIDENQFVLTLHEANWNEMLPEIINDLNLRASVRGRTIELNIQSNLPTVAIDKISMYEVVSNLIDNAIKYSGQSPKIIVHASLGKDGNINTEVQDFGVGIPQSSLPQLFTKYYRSHRSSSAVGGSGLGLYLVKSIVSAHGGNVWVNSKEGEGSSFGFSLQAYAHVSDKPNTKGQDGIERQASGWIKNHSLYRR